MTDIDFVPAQVFHTSDHIAEECIARGWSLWGFAERTGAPHMAKAVLGWQLYALRDPDILMGDDGAAELERALGASAQFWLNIEAAYRKHEASRAPATPETTNWYGLAAVSLNDQDGRE